jgi:hypothetical protein
MKFVHERFLLTERAGIFKSLVCFLPQTPRSPHTVPTQQKDLATNLPGVPDASAIKAAKDSDYYK